MIRKYVFREPVGKTIQDSEKELEARRVAIMSECVKQSSTLITFRIGRHISGPFQGLYTLEKQEKGKWVPVKDGDLLVQILDDIHLETQRIINGDPNRKAA